MLERPIRFLSSATAIVLVGGLAAAGAPRAHSPAPEHGCTAPVRPSDDRDDIRWQRFLDDVDAFRACISDYVAANYHAADVHQDAANEATMAWNRFVRAELNVPEDYPWPPEEAEGGR